MREKKGGALQKLKKRLSHSFGRLSKYLSLSLSFYAISFFFVLLLSNDEKKEAATGIHCVISFRVFVGRLCIWDTIHAQRSLGDFKLLRNLAHAIL